MPALSRLLQISVRCCQTFAECSMTALRFPVMSARDLANLPQRQRGAALASGCGFAAQVESPPAGAEADPNPLRLYFDEIREGPGVWKWLHYFEIYHRHLAKFVGRQITMVEVGVYSGGSMPM